MWIDITTGHPSHTGMRMYEKIVPIIKMIRRLMWKCIAAIYCISTFTSNVKTTVYVEYLAICSKNAVGKIFIWQF